MKLYHARYGAEILDPRKGFERVRAEVEVRRDPLTGQSCRLLPEGSVPRPERQELDDMAARSRDGCPFCGERVERLTPRFPPEVSTEGRFRRGEAVAFPNLLPYGRWSSVSIYSARLHLLPIGSITPSLMADNLATQVAFVRGVQDHDPSSAWACINANQFPPSGSSILHPHLQGMVNPEPTTVQRLLAELPAGLVREYVEAERSDERFIGSTGRVAWLASFAPVGPAELRGFVPGIASFAEVDDGLIGDLALGLSLALGVYDDLGFQSFNLACYGAPPGAADPWLVLRVVARAYFGPLLRSDAMWMERLHWEAATDLWPERVADRARSVFGGG